MTGKARHRVLHDERTVRPHAAGHLWPHRVDRLEYRRKASPPFGAALRLLTDTPQLHCDLPQDHHCDRPQTDYCAVCPRREASSANLFDQHNIAYRISELLDGECRRTRTDGAPSQVTIALLGRYGQGKTSVLHQIRCHLQRRGWRVGELDISRFRPEEVLYEFETVVAPWLLRRNWHAPFAFTVIALFGLFLIVHLLGSAWRDLTKGLNAASAVALLGAFGWLLIQIADLLGLRPAFRALWRRRLFGDRSAFSEFWQRIRGGMPDVIFIDNLDRADAEQQKALLRAIRRQRSDLDCPIVVAADLGAIIASKPDPESPADLLDKVFTLEITLSPMTLADARELAEHLLDSAIVHNKGWSEAWVRSLFGAATARADFARILYLLRRHSARFAKLLVNDLLVAADQHGLAHGDHSDLAALMRLHALFALLPALRHDVPAVATLLRDNDGAGMIRHVEGVLGQPVAPDIRHAVAELISATGHMHPALAAWQHFLGAPHAMRVVSIGGDQWHPNFSDPVMTRQWQSWDGALASRAQDAVARLRLLRRCGRAYLSHCPEFDAERPGSLPPRTQGDYLCWAYLLHRLWLSDASVLAIMPSEERDRLLRLAWNPEDDTHPAIPAFIFAQLPRLTAAQASEFLRLLPTAPGGMHDLVHAAIFAASPFMGIRPDADAIPPWIRGASPTPPSSPVARRILGSIVLNPVNAAPLESAWPHIAKPLQPSEVAWDVAFSQFRSYRQVRAAGMAAAPTHLGEFLGHLAWIDDGTLGFRSRAGALLRVLCPAFDPETPQPWDAAAVRAVWFASTTTAPGRFAARASAWLEGLAAGRCDGPAVLFFGGVWELPHVIAAALAGPLPIASEWDRGYLDALMQDASNLLFDRTLPHRSRVEEVFTPVVYSLRTTPDAFERARGRRLAYRLRVTIDRIVRMAHADGCDGRRRLQMERLAAAANCSDRRRGPVPLHFSVDGPPASPALPPVAVKRHLELTP